MRNCCGELRTARDVWEDQKEQFATHGCFHCDECGNSVPDGEGHIGKNESKTGFQSYCNTCWYKVGKGRDISGENPLDKSNSYQPADAIQKICPIISSGYGTNENAVLINCQVEDCMAWRWIDSPGTDKGFCGLCSHSRK